MFTKVIRMFGFEAKETITFAKAMESEYITEKALEHFLNMLVIAYNNRIQLEDF